MTFLIVEVWKPDKEVYRFDAELEFALSDIEEIEVPVRILDRLPYQTFYLEFAEDGIYSSHFHGAFIHLIKEGLGYHLYVMRLTEDGKGMFGVPVLFQMKTQKMQYFINIQRKRYYLRRFRERYRLAGILHVSAERFAIYLF